MTLFILNHIVLFMLGLAIIIFGACMLILNHIAVDGEPSLELRVDGAFIIALAGVVFTLILLDLQTGSIKYTDEPVKMVTVDDNNQEVKVTTESGTYYLDYIEFKKYNTSFDSTQKYYLKLPKEEGYKEYVRNSKKHLITTLINLELETEEKHQKFINKHKVYDLDQHQEDTKKADQASKQ